MQFFYDILPVFLFFLAFKFFDIYVATVVGIICTLLQAVIYRCYQKKWDRKQLITFLVFLVFGGMTLYFHNPIFVKWKPTILFGVFALAILLSQVFTKKPLMQRLMEGALEGKARVPVAVWKKLDILWGAFFLCLGLINLYVAYYFSNEVWVNFKFYGITLALIVVSIVQAVYLMPYFLDTEKK